MIKHYAGAEEVGHMHTLCADKLFSLNIQFLPITSSSVIYQLLVIRTHNQLSIGNRQLIVLDNNLHIKPTAVIDWVYCLCIVEVIEWW